MYFSYTSHKQPIYFTCTLHIFHLLFTPTHAQPPRARGAFTIYAAEQYDALDTKPTGLTGYRTWLNGVRATWNGLEKTQQDAYVAKSTGVCVVVCVVWCMWWCVCGGVCVCVCVVGGAVLVLTTI